MDQLDLPMPHIQTGDSAIFYEVHGEGPPLLLVHGVGGNHASWFRQIPTFARHFQVIVFDQRGFGNSTDVEGLGRSALVDDIALLLDGLGVEKTAIVAQSMGAGAAAAFTCRYPARVQALVHCDSMTGVRLAEPHASALKAHNLATANLPRIERVLGPMTVFEDPEATLLYLQLSNFNSVNFKTIKGSSEAWTPEALAATGVPVLFVVGEDDALFPWKLVWAMHKQTLGSSFVTIPGAGHSAYFEAASEFNRVVLDFLADANKPA